MGAIRYSINVSVDGSCDHRGMPADDELHAHHAHNLARADTLLLGRVTYQMMEDAFRPAPGADAPEDPFARTIHAMPKHVVSTTLESVDWNADLVRGDLATAVARIREASPRGVHVGGVRLPRALAALGLIDEYEIVVLPRITGHGPRILDGLPGGIDLEPTGRTVLASGAVALRYAPRGRSCTARGAGPHRSGVPEPRRTAIT